VHAHSTRTRAEALRLSTRGAQLQGGAPQTQLREGGRRSKRVVSRILLPSCLSSGPGLLARNSKRATASRHWSIGAQDRTAPLSIPPGRPPSLQLANINKRHGRTSSKAATEEDHNTGSLGKAAALQGQCACKGRCAVGEAPAKGASRSAEKAQPVALEQALERRWRPGCGEEI
jgi:hypothetical protein